MSLFFSANALSLESYPTQIMHDRVTELRAGIEPTMRGLEYGPSYSPLFPVSEGWNIIIADHASQADLIQNMLCGALLLKKLNP
jgi:hypothetical protein